MSELGSVDVVRACLWVCSQLLGGLGLVFLDGLTHMSGGWLAVGWAVRVVVKELHVSHPPAGHPGSIHMWLGRVPKVARTEA